ncbi:MAG: Lrp/AsnC family transcriptional regulator [Candidatus Odinarchaeota archaeon]|nr:Lrp/AsnC family transcriptional regulator [Candidatus Odinarchaeota archaeon]
MKKLVDEIDLKILRELMNDSRCTYEKLASKIGISVPTAYNRVRKLIKKGIIKRFTIDVDYTKIGYPIRALVGVVIDPRHSADARTAFQNLENVIRIVEVTGRFDYILDIIASGTNELKELLTEKMSKIRGVMKTETMVQVYCSEKLVI